MKREVALFEDGVEKWRREVYTPTFHVGEDGGLREFLPPVSDGTPGLVARMSSPGPLYLMKALAIQTCTCDRAELSNPLDLQQHDKGCRFLAHIDEASKREDGTSIETPADPRRTVESTPMGGPQEFVAIEEKPPSCARCRFLRPNPAGFEFGECRRRSPGPGGKDSMRDWPHVLGTDWCGEFEGRGWGVSCLWLLLLWVPYIAIGAALAYVTGRVARRHETHFSDEEACLIVVFWPVWIAALPILAAVLLASAIAKAARR